MSLRVVFMGSPEFALPTLEELHQNYKIVGVVSQPDRPAGRGRLQQPCAVKARALELGLPVFQPESMKRLQAVAEVAKWKPDLIVVAAFGQILPKEVLELPEKGCLNVHASLLPRWRGAAPIQAAIAAGDDRSGVTIMVIEEGLDTGPMLAQREVPIRPETNAEELSHQLAFLGAKTLIEVLPAYLSGKLAPSPQDDESKTYAHMLKKSDGLLDFSLTAQQLKRKVLAYQPWPGTFFSLDGHNLKVLSAHVHDTYDSEIGDRYVANGLPAIGTAQGLLVLEQVQPEGKRIMSGEDFLRGQQNWL